MTHPAHCTRSPGGDRLARQLRLESRIWDGAFLITVLWILCGALPFVAALVISLVMGNYPVEGEPAPEGFPAFTPPWPGMYLAVAVLVVVAIASIPLPLRGTRRGTRSVLNLAGAFTTVSCMLVLGLVGAREGTLMGLDWVLTVAAVTTVVLWLRSILGMARLVPRAWREYVDDEGRVLDPREVERPYNGRPWARF
ncbi:hypothetical protein [Agromyces salentinus]|uniref:Uncharacterized protein n=1 Tax=Agromyces salentinus TaxID=269421 RepID=A0ABN2MEG3_9MICO|nr:hypothetical protein [Agromyces salentinus]